MQRLSRTVADQCKLCGRLKNRAYSVLTGEQSSGNSDSNRHGLVLGISNEWKFPMSTPKLSFKYFCTGSPFKPNNSQDSETNVVTRSKTKFSAKYLRKKDADSKPEKEWIAPEGRDTNFKVYNSLTRRKESLILPHGRLASWYICGPTVYDHTHIGHACSYIRFDMLRRILTNFFNLDIVVAMGITDIDDKIINRARELNMNFHTLSRQFENEFHKDMSSLKVLPPTVTVRVTDVIPKIIDYTQQILDNGYAYVTSGGTVYFDVVKYGRYGKLLSHSMTTEIRHAVDKDKKNPRDFALWKSAKPGEPFWDSPWGKGRPGWHIECSTMASQVFGQNLDIHCGGIDLQFPHHENEIAQSQAYFKCEQWCNYWLHAGHLHLPNQDEKMSKSLRNTISVGKLLQDYTANQFRIFCMLSPYRSNIEFSKDRMQKAVRAQQQLASFLGSAEAYIKGQLLCEPVDEELLMRSLIETKKKFKNALADDFDTPRALTIMMDLVHLGNKQLQKRTKEASGPRSPGVFAFMVTYIDSVLEMMGIQFTGRKTLYSTETHQQLSGIMDSAVKFRNKVRIHSLTSKETTTQLKQNKSANPEDAPKKERHPLLQACDELRDDLVFSGFRVKDYGKESGWEVIEDKGLQSKFKSFNPSHPKYGSA